MENWNATNYLKFGDERTRAASDLVGRIALQKPAVVIDLGCGPGNSTQCLQLRWPDCNLTGIDSSRDMIDTARRKFPTQSWRLGDIASWEPASPIDLVYSNAALQWLPKHDLLVPRLFSFVASGGALAFQIPSAAYSTIRTLMHEISFDPAWTERMIAPRGALTMESPSFYYDLLAPEAIRIDIWETEYFHVMTTHDDIVEWISSTGLRPFLAALETGTERERFVAELRSRVKEAYSLRSNGSVLFPFRRTFVIAYR